MYNKISPLSHLMLICIFPFVLESVLLEVHLYYSSFQRQTLGFMIFSGIIFIFCFITVWSVDQKKCTWELWIKFYWGRYEDLSPGDSTWVGSEKLLQRGRGMVSIYVILWRENTYSQAHIFCRNFLLVSWSFC